MQTYVLIYCRVSGKKQVLEGSGLSSQEQKCREYAKNILGLGVEKVFYDGAISGGVFERKAMKELLTYIDKNKKNSYVVVFEDLNRLSRDIQVHYLIKNELEKRKVVLYCPNFKFENTPEGIFRENMSVIMAQYEKDKNKERVGDRQLARLQQGFRCFPLPIGLKYTKSPEGGKIVIFDESNYKIVKAGLEKFANDELKSLKDLTLYFLNYGLSVGGWRFKSNYRGDYARGMLTNILYTGYLEYEKWGVDKRKAKHEALISLNTHEKILKKLKRISEDTIENKVIQNNDRNDTSADFPLRGFLYCEESKLMLSGGWAKGRHKKYPYYTFPRNSPLAQSTIKRDLMHDQFESILRDITPNEDLIELFKKAYKIAKEKREENKQENLKHYDNELNNIDIQINKFVERIGKTDSEILVENYEKEIEKLEDQKKETLEKMKNTKQVAGTTLKTKLQLAKDGLKIWESNDLELQKNLIENIFPAGIPINKKKRVGTACFSLIYQAFEVAKTKEFLLVGMGGLEPPTSTLSV